MTWKTAGLGQEVVEQVGFEDCGLKYLLCYVSVLGYLFI